MPEEKLSLVNIRGGAAVEMFDIALQKVLENIHDINTTEEAREITLKVKIKPVPENRSVVVYSIACPTKICGQAAVKGTAEINTDTGHLVAIDRVPKQEGLFSNVEFISRGDE